MPAGLLTAALGGCISPGSASATDLVWGRRGFSAGRFIKPRAIAVDADDRLYIVDMTARIQVFDADGEFLYYWKTPAADFGRPTGLSVLSDADAPPILLVADTHYYRMLAYRTAAAGREPASRPTTEPLDLQPLRQIGGTAGHGPGQFAFVTDAVCDSEGNHYIGEYGDSDRIQKFDRDGHFLTQWGGTGTEDGLFVRPQSLAIDAENRLWIADSCNHRIQLFDLSSPQPRHLKTFGTLGAGLGEFYYPYDLAIVGDGTIIVCEYGNQRLQRIDESGRGIAVWGSPGHAPGQLYQPWGAVIDSRQRIHVLDSNNHRVQRLRMFG